MPGVPNAFATVDQRKALLESMIRNKLLALEADHRGIDKTAAVQEAIERAKVQELIRQVTDEAVKGVSEDDLRRYYDEHKSEYSSPEMVRASRILLRVEPGKPKALVEAKAQALLRSMEAAQRKGKVDAFAEAARKESQDPPTAQLGGQLHAMPREVLEKATSREFGDAAWQLLNPGEMALVETPQGYEIARLDNHIGAGGHSFEEVKEQVRQRLARQRRAQAVEDVVKKLRESTPVEIDEVELAKLGP